MLMGTELFFDLLSQGRTKLMDNGPTTINLI